MIKFLFCSFIIITILQFIPSGEYVEFNKRMLLYELCKPNIDFEAEENKLLEKTRFEKYNPEYYYPVRIDHFFLIFESKHWIKKIAYRLEKWDGKIANAIYYTADKEKVLYIKTFSTRPENEGNVYYCIYNPNGELKYKATQANSNYILLSEKNILLDAFFSKGVKEKYINLNLTDFIF
ncbi:hypothetical protein IJE86_10500 [bacterium]|nr:hypothetical protein [bacterium]